MKIYIQSPHFTPYAELKNFVRDRVNKLEQYNHRILAGKVCLKLDTSDTADDKVCEIILEIPGNDLFAKRQCKTFEEATVQAVDALQHQIERHKR